MPPGSLPVVSVECTAGPGCGRRSGPNMGTMPGPRESARVPRPRLGRARSPSRGGEPDLLEFLLWHRFQRVCPARPQDLACVPAPNAPRLPGAPHEHPSRLRPSRIRSGAGDRPRRPARVDCGGIGRSLRDRRLAGGTERACSPRWVGFVGPAIRPALPGRRDVSTGPASRGRRARDPPRDGTDGARPVRMLQPADLQAELLPDQPGRGPPGPATPGRRDPDPTAAAGPGIADRGLPRINAQAPRLVHGALQGARARSPSRARTDSRSRRLPLSPRPRPR